MMMLMDIIYISIVLVFFGLTLGSFAGATVWRLRAQQLRDDAKHKHKIAAGDKEQVAKIPHVPLSRDRSVCLHCGHALSWYDLIPVLSWASLRGKCRYCHKRIGWLEPVLEVGLALFFVMSFLFWPFDLTTPIEVARLLLWLIAGVGMAILFVYDAKWFLLPNKVVFPLIGVGVLNALLVIATAQSPVAAAVSVLLGCGILSGVYYLIYVYSGHKWVGFGDVKLGLALALLLADWRLAVIALFLANLVGTIIILPLLLGGRLKRQAHVPFGPLLIVGWAISGLFGAKLLYWYLFLSLGV